MLELADEQVGHKRLEARIVGLEDHKSMASQQIFDPAGVGGSFRARSSSASVTPSGNTRVPTGSERAPGGSGTVTSATLNCPSRILADLTSPQSWSSASTQKTGTASAP